MEDYFSREAHYLPSETNSQAASQFADYYSSLDVFTDIGHCSSEQQELMRQIFKDVKQGNFLPISLCSEKDTVTIDILCAGTQRLPLAAMPVIVKAKSIKCSTKFLIGDVQINGFTLHFSSPVLASTYVQMLGLHVIDETAVSVNQNQTIPNGLISRTGVSGYIEGKEIKFSECDVELECTALNLFSPGSTTRIACFNFADPLFSIDGTSDAFIVSNRPDTVVRIEPESIAFHKAILSNKLVRSAAHRAANKGPYLATMQSGTLVHVEVGDTDIRLTSGCEVRLVSIDDVSVDIAWEGNIPCLMTPIGGLTAQLPMLECIASAVTAIKVKSTVQNNFKNTVSAMLGLEGQYFTYSLFGQLADTHLGLAEELGISPFDEMSSIQGEQDKTTFLMFMLQNIVPIAQHIETTLNYLPSFASGMDAEFLNGVGLREHFNLKNNEFAYQRALQPITSLLSHLYKIDGAVSRLISLRKQLLAQEGGWGKFAPLGLSLAAGLVNPFFLIGAAQQGSSLMTRGDAQANLEKDTREDIFAICVKEWDYLIHTLLPAAAYRVAQEIYPIRLNVSGCLLGAYEKASDATKPKLVNKVATRYANLETFKTFSASSVPFIPRIKSIDFMFELQKHAEAFQFRHF